MNTRPGPSCCQGWCIYKRHMCTLLLRAQIRKNPWRAAASQHGGLHGKSRRHQDCPALAACWLSTRQAAAALRQAAALRRSRSHLPGLLALPLELLELGMPLLCTLRTLALQREQRKGRHRGDRHATGHPGIVAPAMPARHCCAALSYRAAVATAMQLVCRVCRHPCPGMRVSQTWLPVPQRPNALFQASILRPASTASSCRPRACAQSPAQLTWTYSTFLPCFLCSILRRGSTSARFCRLLNLQVPGGG